eukprot:4861741-Pyramimonas_sp.AAC.1
MSCCVLSCHVVLWRALSCRVVSCRIMLCADMQRCSHPARALPPARVTDSLRLCRSGNPSGGGGSRGWGWRGVERLWSGRGRSTSAD